jgi:hypothetical protein
VRSDALDLTGERFGHLVVIERDGKDKHGHWYWLCRCDFRGCESTTVVAGGNLRRGHTVSCGCARGHKRSYLMPDGSVRS